MTPLQIEAVKNSWSKVTPIADQASVLFSTDCSPWTHPCGLCSNRT